MKHYFFVYGVMLCAFITYNVNLWRRTGGLFALFGATFCLFSLMYAACEAAMA